MNTDLVHKAVSNFTPFCPANLIAKEGETDTVSVCNTLLSRYFFLGGKVEEVEREMVEGEGGKWGPNVSRTNFRAPYQFTSCL